MTTGPAPNPVPHSHVAIIGTGFGGIAAAIRWGQAGVDDIVMPDRTEPATSADVWRDNDHGRNTTIWPGTTLEFRRRTPHFDPAHHLPQVRRGPRY